MLHNKSLQLTKIPVTNFASQNIAPGIFATELSVTRIKEVRMELKNIVPWGRSFQEYKKMFCLTDQDITKSILGCGDGPASFNTVLTKRGGSVISIDPTYSFSREQLKSRIAEVYDEIMPQMEENQDNYIWDSIASVKELGEVRMSAMEAFLVDYERGKEEKRYIEAALPSLPFESGQFDLAVCSHFLFLYSEQINLQQHLDAIQELTRVAKEVRVYPLVTLKDNLSPHLETVINHLSKLGIKCELVDSEYRFQKGAHKMLVVKSL